MKCFEKSKPTYYVSNINFLNNTNINTLNESNLILDFNNFEDYSLFLDVFKILQEKQVDFSLLNICIKINKFNFSKTEAENFNKFNQLLIENDGCLQFYDNAIWNMEEFNNTFNALSKIVANVKDKNLSPFEQFLYLYNTVASHEYNDTLESKLDPSRSVIGIFNSNKIVCLGYAELFRTLCYYLNNPNIKCDCVYVDLLKKQTKELYAVHAFNLVYLKDEKYSINGMYACDACWDSAKENTTSLSHCLVPIKDVLMYKDFIVKPTCTNKYIYFFEDEKPKFLLKAMNSLFRNALKMQGMFNIQEERLLFKDAVLKKLDQEKQETALKKLEGEDRFLSEGFEYSFLRHMSNKILDRSTVVDYEKFSKALFELRFMFPTNISCSDYIKNIIDLSKTRCLQKYTLGAKNCFYCLASANQITRQARNQKLEKKKQEKSKRRDIKKEI